ncbi:response regulator [Flavobacterium sp. ACN6]|uniref:response regulator n=1 Tax=Flavobacterium sp. ACN6 TaxID=1920426 RepID=UPI000BB345E1|nr:response regulator [Flavobacterium sp. ACN6]PBJ15897.1 Polar-differentiation response regulator DivK [Flavobacterium sp. ACN6]
MAYKNILLIDDDREDAELFMEAADTLNKGVCLRWAFNPAAEFDHLLVTENLPDLIFLDYNMPRMNGLELLEKLKAEKRLANIPVILISTPSENFADELVRSEKIIKYISKPTSYKELIVILDSLL